MCEGQHEANCIFDPIPLLSGRRVSNRLVKVAMYEHLASFGGGPPNSYHFRLYSEWAKHNWGIIITGNVAVTQDHLTLGRDMALPARADMQTEEALLPFRELAKSIHGTYSDSSTRLVDSNKTLAIMQLNHSGRQSTNIIGGRPPFKPPLAPSSIRVASSGSSMVSRALNNFMFQLPEAMTQHGVQEVIERFVEGAILAYKTGFDGVQLHAAHGYLLAQFLSPKTNTRMDIYSAENALDIVHNITRGIRKSTSDSFIISIKFNAADYISGAKASDSPREVEQRAIGHLLNMASWRIFDFVEISGGDYEKPDFMMNEFHSQNCRQAFFSNFSHKAMEALHKFHRTTSISPPLILLTGGLKTLDILSTVLEHNHANLLGIGRASVICPNFPDVLRERLKHPQLHGDEPFGREPDLSEPRILTSPLLASISVIVANVKIVGAGTNMAWYVVTIRGIATAGTASIAAAHKRGRLTSILWMWLPIILYKANTLRHLEKMLMVAITCIAVILAYRV